MSGDKQVRWHVVITCPEEIRREAKAIAAKNGMRVTDFISTIVVGRVADMLGGLPSIKEEQSARTSK